MHARIRCETTHEINPDVILSSFTSGSPDSSYACSMLNVASSVAIVIKAPLTAMCLPGQMLKRNLSEMNRGYDDVYSPSTESKRSNHGIPNVRVKGAIWSNKPFGLECHRVGVRLFLMENFPVAMNLNASFVCTIGTRSYQELPMIKVPFGMKYPLNSSSSADVWATAVR